MAGTAEVSHINGIDMEELVEQFSSTRHIVQPRFLTFSDLISDFGFETIPENGRVILQRQLHENLVGTNMG